jgi:hypothetical protein
LPLRITNPVEQVASLNRWADWVESQLKHQQTHVAATNKTTVVVSATAAVAQTTATAAQTTANQALTQSFSAVGGPGTQVYTSSGTAPPTWTNQTNTMSGDQTVFGILTGTGTTQIKSGTYILSNFGFANQNYATLILSIKSAVTTNTLDGTGNVWIISYSLDGGITFTQLRAIAPGVTYSAVTVPDTVNLSLTQNLSAIQVKYVSQQNASDTSGSLVCDIYTPQILGSH